MPLGGLLVHQVYFQIREFVEKCSRNKESLVGSNIDSRCLSSQPKGVLVEGDAEKAQERIFQEVKKGVFKRESNDKHCRRWNDRRLIRDNSPPGK